MTDYRKVRLKTVSSLRTPSANYFGDNGWLHTVGVTFHQWCWMANKFSTRKVRRWTECQVNHFSITKYVLYLHPPCVCVWCNHATEGSCDPGKLWPIIHEACGVHLGKTSRAFVCKAMNNTSHSLVLLASFSHTSERLKVFKICFHFSFWRIVYNLQWTIVPNIAWVKKRCTWGWTAGRWNTKAQIHTR